MDEKWSLICDKCRMELKEMEVQFTYLNKGFRHKVLRCPQCGQVYLPEKLVTGRMSQVERQLEEK